MSRGKRFEENQKFNIKKILMFIAVVAVIFLFFYGIKKLLKKEPQSTDVFSEVSYIAIYENEKWGVANSKGDVVINPDITSMIVVPNSKKEVFIYEEEGKAKAVNANKEQLFTAYSEVECIVNSDKDGNVVYEKNVLKAQKDGKFGLIDLAGNEILPTIYDEITPIKGVENSLVIKKDEKYGLSNASGNVIIEPEYEQVTALTNDYTNGYIVKNSDENFGIIGIDKTQILDCKYSNMRHVFGSDKYIVKEGDVWKIVKNNEDEGIEIKYNNVKSINNDLLVVVNGDSYGIIDAEQNEKVALDYQYLEYAFLDYFIAKKDNKYGVINSSGETVVEYEYDYIKYDIEADCLVGTKNIENKKYLINRDLELKQTCESYTVNNGYIRAKIDGDYKFFNLKFEEKTNKEVYPDNTLFVTKRDGKFGLEKKDGTLVVTCQYDDMTEQNEYGYIAMKKDDKWGIIDQYANTVVEPKYTLDPELNISVVGKWILTKEGNLPCYTCR